MNEWLNTFLEEKGIDLESPIDVMGESGMNYMTVGVIVEHIQIASTEEKKQIKNQLVKIDFHNASVMNFLVYLAEKIAR